MKRWFILATLGVTACGGDDASSLPPGTTPDAATRTDATFPMPDAAPPPVDAASDSPTTPDAPPKPTRTLVYVGAGDSKIHVYTLDRAALSLTPLATYAAGNFPSFLAFDLAHDRVFATNENAGGVAAFSLDPQTGALAPKNTITIAAGAGTTHVSIDHTATLVLAANYGNATASVLPIQAAGTLAASVATLTPGTNPHCFVASPDNAYAFVVAKGSDQIAQYTLDAAGQKLAPNPTAAAVKTPAGAGPRHLVFHPGGAFAYVIDENDSTVRAYAYDAAHGTLTEIQSLSSLPAGFTGTNTGAEIQMMRSGKFLFVSNRGDDSVVSFSIDGASGKLTYVARTSTGGTTPRHFSLDEDDGALLVANQGSGSVAVFRLDATTAGLTPVGSTTIGASPYYVEAISLP